MTELTDELKQQYQTYNQDELDYDYIMACKNGHLTVVQYLLTSVELNQHANPFAGDNRGLQRACESGHLHLVDYLINSIYSNLPSDTTININESFYLACKNGHLHIIKYLLNTGFLISHHDKNMGLTHAAEDGHLNVVQYLLTSSELTEHADIHYHNDWAFITACTYGQLEVVKYLLTSPELTEHADIHADDDKGLYEAYFGNHYDLVHYLLTSKDLHEHANIHADDGFIPNDAFVELKMNFILLFLSLNNHQAIDIVNEYFNLTWAIEHQYDDIILAMMRNLKNNNPFEYMESLPKIEQYNKELYDHVKNMEVEGLEVNSQETSLFV